MKLAELAASLRTAIGTESTSGDPNSGTGLLKYLSRFGCALLNAGCFAAGTKLNTPNGFRNVEDLTEGDLVYAKSEFDPAAPIEAKPIEQVFRRFTEIVHVHAGGQLLRTTQEHPFYVHERGWTPVAEINPGDWLLTDTGDWKQVEEVFFTGELEVVYNLRVADHHTYFVGDDGWGWALWAHNLYVYRGMEEQNGVPAIGDSKKKLGVTTLPEENPDIQSEADGVINPPNDSAHEGMSTAISIPALPKHRRNIEWGGSNKSPTYQVWGIDTDKLGPDLLAFQDSDTHVTIGPSRIMSIADYRMALASTQLLWILQKKPS